ncbi:MAG: nucleotidyltransferase family protein [Gammaproteobacteria bacterium]|nr:nucleotidyltransferase family protein [Gammaproteobacteria bacterium]MCW8987325.1 nucleotidyltransferase family protein [Gammaproteobacteria bacterium]
MRAMILAAGRGERMRPLTDALPKPLLKVGGKMLIEYHLEKLKAAEVTDVVINHAWLGEKIEQALGDGARFGLNISYSAETEALETAGGIVNALPLLGSTPFIVINADIFCDVDFSTLVAPIAGLAHLLLVDNPEHNKDGDFALTESGYVQQNGQSKLTFSGIGIYHPDLFKHKAKGKRALAPVLREAMDKQLVTGSHYQGMWHDIGTPARLTELDLYLKNS